MKKPASRGMLKAVLFYSNPAKLVQGKLCSVIEIVVAKRSGLQTTSKTLSNQFEFWQPSLLRNVLILGIYMGYISKYTRNGTICSVYVKLIVSIISRLN